MNQPGNSETVVGKMPVGTSQTAHPKYRGKVLLLTPHLNIGGLEKMILDLSRGLRAQGSYEPHILAYDMAFPTREVNSLLPEITREKIQVDVNKKDGGFSFPLVLKIATMCRDREIDVIHTHDLGALIYGALAKIRLLGKVRIVHTQHSFFDLNENAKFRIYHRVFSYFADELVVVSDDTKKTYIDLGISPNKVEVIKNGVPFSNQPVISRAERLKEREILLRSLDGQSEYESLAEGRNDYWILYLARVHPIKGQRHALSLWAKLPESVRAKCRLLIIGPSASEGELDRIKALAKESPSPERILTPGGTTATRDWINSSDLFLSCSEFEGLPLSPIESVGQGTPVLLSDIPGHEFLKDMASFYSLADPVAGASALTKILDSVETQSRDWQSALEKNAAWIREQYSLEMMTKAYSAVYDQVLK